MHDALVTENTSTRKCTYLNYCPTMHGQLSTHNLCIESNIVPQSHINALEHFLKINPSTIMQQMKKLHLTLLKFLNNLYMNCKEIKQIESNSQNDIGDIWLLIGSDFIGVKILKSTSFNAMEIFPLSCSEVVFKYSTHY